MSFMDAVIDAGISTNSNDYWNNLEQSYIDGVWDNSTQIATGLKEQRRIGSTIDPTYIDPAGTSEESKQAMIDVEAWHSSALDVSGTTYYRTDTQAIKFLFRDIHKINRNGSYYYWNGNYWLSYFEYSESSYQSFVVCVRCDNELKFIDPQDGQVYSWPCRINNEAAVKSHVEMKFLLTPSNVYNVEVQRNEQTERLFRVNRRFLIGGGGTNDNLRAFKITGIQNSHKDYKEQNAGILYLTMEMDELHEYDGTDPSLNYYTRKEKCPYGVAYNSDDHYIPPVEVNYIIEPNFDCLYLGVPKTFEIVKAAGWSQDKFNVLKVEWYNAGSAVGKIVQDPQNQYKWTVTSNIVAKNPISLIIKAERKDGAGLSDGKIPLLLKSRIG